MVDRFLVWLGAGVVTAGVSAAMIAGAGVAVAQDGAASGAGGGTTSESSNSTESKQDSSTDPAGPTDDGADEPDPTDADPTDPDEDATAPDIEETTDEEQPAEEPAETTEDDATSDSDTDRSATAPVKPKPVDTPDEPVTTETGPEQKVVIEEEAETSGEPLAAAVDRKAVVVETVDTEAPEMTETPEVAATAFAVASPQAAIGATAVAPQAPGLINVIGTIVFNLYAFATRVLGGPPILPPGSTVTVRSSSLRIDCGDGYVVPADWYIPAGAEEDPPERLIYLNHGFLAAGPWYSHTAAALAEQTNSIVVAPSLTSNFLSCDACWLGAPPMHRAVADLFEDENTALADSALAAGYSGPIPDRVVLIGHSLGGGLVAGTARYMVENETIDRLAGVVMLDGVGLDDTMAESLDLVPDDIPIYQLAAPKYFWNQFGVGSAALLEARPDQFIGVTLVDGSHVDAMQGGNPIIQFSQQLVSGFSTPQNVAAAQILMVGWVNDMFDPPEDPTEADGIYADPGEELTIDTPAGQASAVALPNSLTKPFLWDLLQPLLPLANAFFIFEPTCVAESVGAKASCEETVAA